jgi:hypothetical protein
MVKALEGYSVLKREYIKRLILSLVVALTKITLTNEKNFIDKYDLIRLCCPQNEIISDVSCRHLDGSIQSGQQNDYFPSIILTRKATELGELFQRH